MSLEIDPLIRRYCETYSSPQAPELVAIERSTNLRTPYPDDASDSIQGRLLSLLSHLIQPKLIVEIGTFTGYATACLAQGLDANGQIISIENNLDMRPLVSENIALTDHAHQIDVRYGDALSILPAIEGPIDLVFVDATKREYLAYYHILIEKVRSGGLIIADNILWKGKVLTNNKNSKTQGLHDFNKFVATDERVDALMLPHRDGLSIIRKL